MTPRILLINPNSSAGTTRAMVAIAQSAAGQGIDVLGVTAARAPAMITEPDALHAAAAEVLELALANASGAAAIVVAGFGDPGLAEIQARIARPAAGIGEAAMRDAAGCGRRFGIATTTPRLQGAIGARVKALGLADRYTGLQLTAGDPAALLRNPERLCAALAGAVARCIAQDGAEAVVIGGGPLGQAAAELQPLFPVPVIAPIPAAVRSLRPALGR